jgi:hypothetical protein
VGGEGAAAKRKRRFPQPQPTARRPWAAADGRPGATCVLSLSVPAAAAPRIATGPSSPAYSASADDDECAFTS